MRNVIDIDEKRVDTFALSDKQSLKLYKATFEGRAAETLTMINYPKVKPKETHSKP